MSRIITYPEADSLNQDDFLVIDGATDGTRKIRAASLEDGANAAGVKRLTFVNGYIDLPGLGQSVSPTVVAASNRKCAMADLNEGDAVFINAWGQGANTSGAATYAFTDENNKIIFRSDGVESAINAQFLISGARHVIVNTVPTKLSDYCAFIGIPPAKSITALEKMCSFLSLYFSNRIYYTNAKTYGYIANRVGTNNLSYAERDLQISCGDAYYFSAIQFSSTDIFEETPTSSGWTRSATVKSGKYFLINFRKSDDSNVTPDDAYNNLRIEKILDKSLSIENEPADSKSTGDIISNITGARLAVFTDGYVNVPAVGETADLTVVAYADTKCAVIPVNEGDVLTINVYGRGNAAGGARTLSFLDENYTVLYRSTSNYKYIHNRYIVPAGSAFAILNTRISEWPDYYAYIGEPIVKRVDRLMNLIQMPDIYFANYIYYVQDGVWGISTTRVGTGKTYLAAEDITVWCSDNYKVSVTTFSSPVPSLDTMMQKSGWVQKYEIPAGAYYLFNFARSDDGNITPDEAYANLFMRPVIDSHDKYDTDYVIDSDFVKRPVSTVYKGVLTYGQSFCVYNNCFYSTDGNNISVQDSTFSQLSTTAITVGHGNGFQLGHNGKAYVSGWDDNKIYVLDLTTSTPTLTDTISLPTTGYTTCAIDDLNGIAYIFQRDTRPNTETHYNFIVYDYVNEQIKSTKVINSFGAMQAADFYYGKIAVMWGLGTTEIPSGMAIYNSSGDMLAEYKLSIFSNVETEGVCFDRSTGDLLISLVNKKVYKITSA